MDYSVGLRLFHSSVLADNELVKIPIEDAPVITLGMFYRAHPGDDLLRRFAQIAKKCFQAAQAPALPQQNR
jgi:hypothetical protein